MHFDLNFKQLKAFYYVAKHLSFTRAAEDLFVTQPAVTMRVDALERHFGTRLFSRDKKHLSLTEEGAVLFSYAERIMLLAYEADHAMHDLREHPRGILRLGTTKTWARVLMPRYITGFHGRFPDIRIQLDEGSSEEMAMSVTYGRNELAIVGRVVYGPELEVLPFPGRETDELVLVCHPAHPLADRRTVTLEDVAGLPLILREQGSGIQQMLQRLAADGGFALEVLLEASSVPFIKDLVAKGVGLSVLTRISLADEVQAGTLKAVPFADGGLWMHVDVVVAREGYRSAAVTTFLDYLAASVAEEGEIYGGEAVVKTPSANSVDE